MKKIIILFLILFTSELLSQTWELMYNESFLPVAQYTGEYEKLNANDISVHNDSILIARSGYNGLIMIYNQKTQESSFITKEDLCEMLEGKYNFKDYDLKNIDYINIDDNGKIWAILNYNSIISIYKDSAVLYKQVFNTTMNDYSNIESIYDLKVDKDGNIWSFIYNTNFNIEPYHNYSICKFLDSTFITLYNFKVSALFPTKLWFINFDKLNRVIFSFVDTLYIVEDEQIIKKISIWDFPNGYGRFDKIVVDSKNNIYALNKDIMLYKYDGEHYESFDYMQKLERFLTKNFDYYYMCIDSSDNIWVTGYQTQSLYKLDTAGNWTCYQVPLFSNAEDKNCHKNDIEADKYGNIWISAKNPVGTYCYGMYVFNPDSTTAVEEMPAIEANNLPDVYIRKLYPNPAIQNVILEFFLERTVSNECKISMYNTVGEKVKDITENFDYDSYNMSARVNFSVSDLPSGAYILTVSAGKSNKTRLMLVGI